MTKFNPFEYILILEECLETPQLYKEKEDIFKNFMECVEKNKNNEEFIEIVEKELNELNKKNGGAKGSPVDPNLTMKEVQKNIDGINQNIKTKVEKAINDVKLILLDDLTTFILNSIKDGKTKKTEKNIKDLLLLTNYGLKTLLECQNILQKIKDEELQSVDRHLNTIIRVINNIIRLATKYESIPPENNFDSSILKMTKNYHKKTNEILSKILKTKYETVNLLAGKAIMASSIIFATMTCLSISTAKNDVETNNITKKILVDDINIIKATDPTPLPVPTSSIDSDIINNTISILKKKCKPHHMMDTFVYILNKIETK